MLKFFNSCMVHAPLTHLKETYFDRVVRTFESVFIETY